MKFGASVTQTLTVRVNPGEETTVVGATGATCATRVPEAVECIAGNRVNGNKPTVVEIGTATLLVGTPFVNGTWGCGEVSLGNIF